MLGCPSVTLAPPPPPGSQDYKDDNHKPEMALALEDFEALCGFVEPAELKQVRPRRPRSIQPSFLTSAPVSSQAAHARGGVWYGQRAQQLACQCQQLA